MTKLEKLEMMAKDLIKYYCPDYTFTWDRSQRRYGRCRYRVKQIGISSKLAKLNPIEETLNAIIHEIAHALMPGHHHDAMWQWKCKQIGGDGLRCYSSSRVIQPSKWTLYRFDQPTSIKRLRRFGVAYPYNWRKENE